MSAMRIVERQDLRQRRLSDTADWPLPHERPPRRARDFALGVALAAVSVGIWFGALWVMRVVMS